MILWFFIQRLAPIFTTFVLNCDRIRSNFNRHVFAPRLPVCSEHSIATLTLLGIAYGWVKMCRILPYMTASETVLKMFCKTCAKCFWTFQEERAFLNSYWRRFWCKVKHETLICEPFLKCRVFCAWPRLNLWTRRAASIRSDTSQAVTVARVLYSNFFR